MHLGKSVVFAVALAGVSGVALAQEAKPDKERKNVQQVPQQETYPGRVTGQTPSADPGGVRGTAPPHPGPGDPPDSVTVTPPGHRTPGAPPGTVTAVEPRGTFGEADKNRSGFIEQDEGGGVAGLDFPSADADRDGRLSMSEFEAATRSSEGQPKSESQPKEPASTPEAAGSPAR